MITASVVAAHLTSYLRHERSLAELVDWAEEVMMEEEFVPEQYEVIRDVVARLGLADVRAFGLTWEDCEQFLERLGYTVNVEVNAL
ncbi:MAG: hypothetical protein HOC74_05265 [Gemmatimonadetes bacterium]|jgi:hypothetical protein|nr:hypothetical protein [Gemmatimonadota bacterium]